MVEDRHQGSRLGLEGISLTRQQRAFSWLRSSVIFCACLAAILMGSIGDAFSQFTCTSVELSNIGFGSSGGGGQATHFTVTLRAGDTINFNARTTEVQSTMMNVSVWMPFPTHFLSDPIPLLGRDGPFNLSGSFIAPTNGVYTVQYSAIAKFVVFFTATCTPAPTITIMTTSLPGATFGTSYTAPALTTSGGTSPYIFSATGLPAGLTLNTGTGVISGTPTQSGLFNVTITATDATTAANGGPFVSASKTVSLAVAAPSITVTTASLPGATFGTSYTAPALAASGGTSPYTFAAIGLPTGLTLNTTSGVNSGTPTQSGSFSIAITATDATTAANGGPFVSAVKALTLLVNRQTTTATLSSSLTAGLLGQQITLTATVAPVTAIGTASFLDGTTALCANVPLSGGTATCATSLKTAGTHSITAVFTSTNANYAGSTSPALAIAITDQTAKTVAAIGAFLGARNNQILSNGPRWRPAN